MLSQKRYSRKLYFLFGQGSKLNQLDLMWRYWNGEKVDGCQNSDIKLIWNINHINSPIKEKRLIN